jgi:hypothetical protein
MNERCPRSQSGRHRWTAGPLITRCVHCGRKRVQFLDDPLLIERKSKRKRRE